MKNRLLEFKKIIDTTKKLYVCEGVGTYAVGYGYYALLELDDEDIKYLKDKYLPKLSEEMDAKINQIKKDYGAV